MCMCLVFDVCLYKQTYTHCKIRFLGLLSIKKIRSNSEQGVLVFQKVLCVQTFFRGVSEASHWDSKVCEWSNPQYTKNLRKAREWTLNCLGGNEGIGEWSQGSSDLQTHNLSKNQILGSDCAYQWLYCTFHRKPHWVSKLVCVPSLQYRGPN